jgi:mannose-6-phosphate isomerase-like protein (cupin superfamily)
MKQIIHKNMRSIEGESTSHSVGIKKVLLTNSECESMLTQVAVGSLIKGEFVDTHLHPTMEEYYFFMKGEAKFIIDDIELSCEKDTFIKVPKNTKHSLMAVSNIEFIYWGIAV